MANIFISHSSKDNQTTKEIFNSLKTISNSIFLDFDTKGHGLKGGDDWEKQLYLRIKKSRIMIVALSPNWLDSQWCYKEYCMARVLRKKIIPVVIESDERIASWDGIDIQYFDATTDDDAIEKLQERISELTQSDISKIYDIKNINAPFVGLRSFNKNEAGIFYGRSEETLDAIDRLNGMADSQSEKFLNIIGASGVGKSSFLKAGILPLLQHFHQESWYLLPIFRAKQEILLNLAKTFAIANDSTAEVLKKLENSEFKSLFDELELFIYDEVKKQNLKPKDLKILLPIDQAEEILSSTNQAQKEQFFKILQYLLEEKSNFFVVWTLRSDHLKKYQDEAMLEFLHQQDETLLLKPIATKELKSIIQEPAYVADILIDESVVDEIKEDIHSTTSLPLLAYFLQELYKNIDKKKRENRQIEIGLNDYKALSHDGKNPIEDIINQQAEKIYKRVTDKKAIENLFLNHLIKVNSDETITKQSTKLKNIPQEQQSIVEQFVERRLFVKDSNDGEDVTVEIAHEALISSWDRLIGWIDGEREFLIFRGHLELYRDSNTLLTGLNLEKAKKFQNKLINEDEKNFVEKSFAYEKRKKIITISIFIIIIISALFSFWQWREAKISEEKAIIQTQKAKKAQKETREQLKIAEHNIGLALLEKSKKAEKEKKYINAKLYAYHALQKLNTDIDVNNIPLARGIISNSPNIYVTKTDIDSLFKIDKKKFQEFIGYKDFSSNIAISSNGGYVAYLTKFKTNIITVFDTDTKTKKKLIGHKKIITDMKFSPNKNLLVSAENAGIIKLWDMKNGTELATLDMFSEKNNINIADLNSSETLKIISESYNNPSLIDSDKDNEKNVSSTNIIDLNLSKSSKKIDEKDDNLSLIDNDMFINDKFMWEMMRKQQKELREILPTSILFTTDGKVLISTLGETIVFWDINKKIKMGEYYIASKNSVHQLLTLSSDNKTLFSITNSGVMTMIDMKNYKTIKTIQLKNRTTIQTIVLSPNNKILALALADGTITLWDIEKEKIIEELRNRKNIISMSMSNNGEMLAVATIDGETTLWNLKTKKTIFKLQSSSKYHVSNFLFSNDNRSLINFINSKKILLWDLNFNKAIKDMKRIYIPNKNIYIEYEGDTIYIRDNISHRIVKKLKTKYETRIMNMLYASNVLAVSSMAGKLKLWDLDKFKEISILNKDLIENVGRISLSLDGKLLAISSVGKIDDRIILYDIVKNKIIFQIFLKEKEFIFNMKFSNDNKTLAYSSSIKKMEGVSYNNKIKLLDIETKMITNLFNNGVSEYPVSDVSFSIDNKLLATSFINSGVVKLWDLNSKKEIKTFETSEDSIFSNIIFSPNRKLLAVNSLKSIEIFNIKTGKLFLIINKKNDELAKSLLKFHSNISFSADGKILYVDSKEINLNQFEKEELKNSCLEIENNLNISLSKINFIDSNNSIKKHIWSKAHPLYWLKSAKNKESMYQLAKTYDKNNEIKKALYWYKKSAQLGYKKAQKRVNMLDKYMMSEEYSDFLYRKAYRLQNNKNYHTLLDVYKEMINIQQNNYFKNKTVNLAYLYLDLAVIYLSQNKLSLFDKALIESKKQYESLLKVEESYPYTNLFKIALLRDKEFDIQLETEFVEKFKEDKNNFIYYEARKILSNISHGKDYNLNKWKKKYKNITFNTDWTAIEIWIDTKKDLSVKKELEKVLEVFKNKTKIEIYNNYDENMNNTEWIDNKKDLSIDENLKSLLEEFTNKRKIEIYNNIYNENRNNTKYCFNYKKYKEAQKCFEKSLIIDPHDSLAFTNLYELDIILNEKVNPSFELAYIDIYKEDKEKFIIYEMLKIIRDIKDGKEADLEKWKKKYKNINLGGWDFAKLNTWVKKLDNNKIKEKIEKLIYMFQEQQCYFGNHNKYSEILISSCQKVLNKNPNNFLVNEIIGDIYKAQYGSNKSIKYYEKSLKLNPDNLDIYVNLGNSYNSDSQYDNALKFYKKAIEINPNQYKIYKKMADIYEKIADIYNDEKSDKDKKNNGDKAIEFYKKAIKNNLKNNSFDSSIYGNSNQRLYELIGNIFYQRKNFDKTIEMYQKSLDLEPTNYNTYIALGNIYKDKKEFKMALKFYKNAIELDSTNTRAYWEMGETYYTYMNNLEEGTKYYQKSLELNTENDYLFYQFYILEILHNRKVKEKYEKQFISLFKNNKDAFMSYEMLKIIENIKEGKEIDLKAWQIKYKETNGYLDFDKLKKWVKTLKDKNVQKNIYNALKFFKNHKEKIEKENEEKSKKLLEKIQKMLKENSSTTETMKTKKL